MKRHRIEELIRRESEFLEQEVKVAGWVRTVRVQKKHAFFSLNDGSHLSGIQIFIEGEREQAYALCQKLSTGSALSVCGLLLKSPGRGQNLEIRATQLTLLGDCPAESYPLQKKHHSFEFLRTLPHLRPRTQTTLALSRLRNTLFYQTHRFFQERGFSHIHTPILTSTDCEGAGEQFLVSTLPRESEEKHSPFFGQDAYLTVSGQLHAEAYSLALGDVYTFGPTFRAENSHTSRHLAEFWMVEPEMAFIDLEQDIQCAQEYIQFCLCQLLSLCEQELQFFEQKASFKLCNRLHRLAEKSFVRISYSEAIEILKQAPRSFTFPVQWGRDIQSEHERYLAEEYFKGAVVVYDYPIQIKPFYVRVNEDDKTVAAMDILLPQVGELVGGSQREEREQVLLSRIEACKLSPENIQWYIDLRRFGSVPHAGFGLGFERFLQFISGMENIRDLIPFPRFASSIYS